jgi:hypothetical protein
MRIFPAHWSPLYLYHRLKQIFLHRVNPQLPWLPYLSVLLIEQLLKATDVGLEVGSGRSTIWFAKSTHKVISLEDNHAWFSKVQSDIATLGLSSKVSLHYIEKHIGYSSFIASLNDKSLDFALIDGGDRLRATEATIPKVKKGGILIIDNANWYLPTPYSSPGSIKTFETIPRDWLMIYDFIKTKRKMWCSNGISDTLIIFI